jgi:nucleotide-binding universal stress UspA family protein
MYKHLLLPTDGSELSTRAVKAGIRFAHSINARVTALHVTPPFHPSVISPGALAAHADEHAAAAKASANRALGAVEEAARGANVPCTVVHRSSDNAWEEIIKTAEDSGCDLIFMASHGRRGVSAVLLGSETNKVLTHSKIPVLICR